MLAAALVAEQTSYLNAQSAFACLPNGAAAMIILLGLVAAERSASLAVHRPLLILGRASYSIYLLQSVGSLDRNTALFRRSSLHSRISK